MTDLDWYTQANHNANKMRAALEKLNAVQAPDRRVRDAIHILVRGLDQHSAMHTAKKTAPAWHEYETEDQT